MQREGAAQPEQRVHVPAEAQDPRAVGDRLVRRRVPVDRHDLEVRLDVGALQLRSHPLAEPLEQADERLLAVQADPAVAHQVAERGDALHVVADVRRRAAGPRVAVVHHREHRAPVGRAGGDRRVGRRLDPRAQPPDLALGVPPGGGVVGGAALEDGVGVARQLVLARAERRRDELEPLLRADARRVVGHERAERGERRRGVDGEAGTQVLGRRVARPDLVGQPAQLGPGELDEAPPERGDAGGQRAELAGALVRRQRQRERLRPGVQRRVAERAHLCEHRLVQRAAALEAAQQLLVGRWRRRADGPGCSLGPRLGPDGPGSRRREHPEASREDEHAAPDRHGQGPACGPPEGGRAPGARAHRRTAWSLAPCSRRNPSCAAKYSSTASRQPDHL